MRDSRVVNNRKSLTQGLNILAAGGIVTILVVAATAITVMDDRETTVSALPTEIVTNG